MPPNTLQPHCVTQTSATHVVAPVWGQRDSGPCIPKGFNREIITGWWVGPLWWFGVDKISIFFGWWWLKETFYLIRKDNIKHDHDRVSSCTLRTGLMMVYACQSNIIFTFIDVKYSYVIDVRSPPFITTLWNGFVVVGVWWTYPSVMFMSRIRLTYVSSQT